MLGFGKKKKYRDEEEDEELTTEEVRKDLKDLKSKNKKQRKEPPKPWGKKERVTVLVFLFGTAAMAGLLGLSSRSWKLPNLPRIVTPELSLEGKYVLEATESDGSEINQVKDQFIQNTQKLSGVYGLYVLRENEQKSYGVFEDETFVDPGFSKILTVVGLFEKLENGELKSSEVNTLVEQLKTSDDVAYTQVLELVTMDYLQNFVNDLGMSNTNVSEKVSTPSDVGKFYSKLLEGRLVNSGHTLIVKDLFTTEDFVGPTDAINIYYEDNNIMTQSGVFFGKQPIIFVLHSKGILPAEGSSAFPHLVRNIYDFEN